MRLLLALLSLQLATPITPKTMTKSIAYRGGLIRFEIPRLWVEKYDSAGGGTFYDESPGHEGTLRLNVISLQAPEGRSADAISLMNTVAEKHPAADKPILLPSGYGYSRWSSEEKDRGVQIRLTTFALAQVVGKRARLAFFTYATPVSLISNSSTASELAFVEEAVRAATFSP